jgi:SAM-dependent MidA family methyltransferase
VDFTAIAQAAADAGLSLLGYTSQAAFLIANGIEKLISAADPNNVPEYLALTRQIKKLTLPQEMGELFKVIALGRGVEHPLTGFSLNDRCHHL